MRPLTGHPVDASGASEHRRRNATRRLLVITYHFPTDGAVGGLRWAGLTKYLARDGWDVVVLTAAGQTESGSEGVLVESCPRRRTVLDFYKSLRASGSGERSTRQTSDGSEQVASTSFVRTIRREVGAALALPDQSRGWMMRAAAQARSLIKRFRPDVIVSSGPPHSAHLVAYLGRIGSEARWLIDLRDPWDYALTPNRLLDPIRGTRLARFFIPRLERLAVNAADAIIANTPESATALARAYPDACVHVVRNGVDLERIPRNEAKPYRGLGIAYVGSLYGTRDIGPILRALRSFLDQHPGISAADVVLRVAGPADVEHRATLQREVARLRLQDHVQELGVLSRTDALELIARSKLVLVLAQGQDLQTPAKLYESVAVGTPTLVVAGGGSAAAREAKRIGAIAVDPEDTASMERLLNDLWIDDGTYAGGLVAEASISYRQLARQVNQLLRIRNSV